jgi:predicted dehydrogenase
MCGRRDQDFMIRLALVGCGKVAEAFHLPALARVEGMTLSAVLDINPSRVSELLAASGRSGVHIATDLSDLVGRCDAALVALPNYLHAPACISLLEQGCHVLVEKPMATSVEDCDRLIAAARGSDAVLSVAMVRRFVAAHKLVREVISKQTFGAIRRIRVAEGVTYNWPATTGFFLKKEQAGGGVLVDFGSHVLDALLWWLGDLTVSAYEDDAYGGVEAECHVRCMSTAGVAVDIELSRLRHLACTARIECEQASIEINLHTGAVDLVIAGTQTPVRGRVGLLDQAGWTPDADPFVLQLRGFASDIRRRAGVTETAINARNVATLFAACAAMRRPLEGPASPAVMLESLGVR